MKHILNLAVLFLALQGCVNREQVNHDKLGIRFIMIPEEQKVDVRIDGELFTSYLFRDDIKKQVLYPIKTSSGKFITRGFPLDTIAGERVDHPHHVGLWMNYGDVNGIDFWNNSEARPKSDRHLYGSIEHRKARIIQEKEKEGILELVNEWKTADGEILLDELTRFVFRAEGSQRIIDRSTVWRAREDSVHFKDSKEGMFAVRVARALELPSDRADFLMGEDGMPGEEKVVDSIGVTGNYYSSEGIEGDAVWGSRARWMELYGVIEGEDVSLVIFDHPNNVGYPTYWMARGYGLFAANPLGQAAYTNGEQVMDFVLAPKESVSFNYRLLIHSGERMNHVYIDSLADEFAKE